MDIVANFLGRVILALCLVLASSLYAAGPSGPRSDLGPSASQNSETKQSSSNQSDKSTPQDKGDTKSQDKTPVASGMTRLRIVVTTNTGKPIGNAAVYVRFPEAGGFLHHDKLSELDLKTNEDGKVRVPEIPQGKILIQVIAKGWHTYGKWYDVAVDEQTIEIKLDPPPHWY
jgi:hypothetical protein